MSAPEQYERRWNRTPSGCLCRASLIWQKELHLGPQTQPANKCRLLKQAIHTHTHIHTQTQHTNTKILRQKEFTLHSIQFKYIYMQEINWKTEVYLPAHCSLPCACTIKPAELLCYCVVRLHSHWEITHQPLMTIFVNVQVTVSTVLILLQSNLRDSFVWGSFKKSRQNSSHYEITLVTSSVPVWNPAHFFCSKILFIVQYYLCNDSSTSCFIGLVPAFEIWGFFSLFLYLGVLAGLSDKISTLRTLLWSQGK